MSPAAATTIAVIGAGSSGIAVAKALKERGLAFDVFEKGSDLGGMWRYDNDNGLSSAYRSLHIDTSRRNLGYPDFPIPADQPDFLSHAQVLAWLEAYAERFAVRPHIRFRTEVASVAPEGQGWRVRLADGEERDYRAVVIANGHLWDPRWPVFPGHFAGEAIHSHHYRTAAPYEDRDVLVVGIGNSAVDIACDLGRRARRVHLSTRRSAWIAPKYILGIPTDRWTGFLTRKLRLPTPVARGLIRWLMLLTQGDQRRYGVPRPAHPIWREHATISQELLPAIGHGRLAIRPDIAELRGHEVAFVDGRVERYDAIVYATGYRTSFPFLDPAVFAVTDGEAALYRRMLPPDRPGLAFAGLVQPIGPTIPLVEIQARWLAAVLAGEVRLPAPDTMRQEIAAHRARIARRYVGSARYTLEVDFREYARQLRADMARGIGGA
ncbi:cation diffusion facilitator CzcD-associated flavoprotein CzcO [Stella humosa]|uniref:Trimethylamine monooxygenase n=1 Tax=Stella humosa TaxID=94 RepID=A0A3N1M211_9PROT|nr:NAD(P)-binding domain-containing protein [Stella humosa]ROQ01554.1 cation diffusion facilitator CzcD-associated flavoprotein CzcO [Stella humosa]BBK31934.1 monooxygenase [Stella humosa]